MQFIPSPYFLHLWYLRIIVMLHFIVACPLNDWYGGLVPAVPGDVLHAWNAVHIDTYKSLLLHISHHIKLTNLCVLLFYLTFS